MSIFLEKFRILVLMQPLKHPFSFLFSEGISFKLLGNHQDVVDVFPSQTDVKSLVGWSFSFIRRGCVLLLCFVFRWFWRGFDYNNLVSFVYFLFYHHWARLSWIKHKLSCSSRVVQLQSRILIISFFRIHRQIHKSSILLIEIWLELLLHSWLKHRVVVNIHSMEHK